MSTRLRVLRLLLAFTVLVGLADPAPVRSQVVAPWARVTETRRTLDTYPFSDPNRTPMLVDDERLYPYHRFEGYAHEPEPREWTVLHLENEWIELWVLPEIGGKVWGARVKESGHEFIYRNEVVKFRNIALRGPWTSGGIEFNFGVIGHTPATATPVDYLARENEDGSVSVFVGARDLPSATTWRVEIRLPPDRAWFETRVRWENPTRLEQPYYNWMTGAAFARDDLVMSIPGTAYLGHPGEEHAWPLDPEGRDLSVYDQNRFGGNKSYHVVGAHEDFFGGYYTEADYGFGHWAPYEEMPGQKLWLWALSRQGGIWDDLLTDTDGQYIEFQAGRMLVQYSATDAVNPISDVGFDPGATDEWSETWFPVEGLGGLSDASRDGAMHVVRDGDVVTVRSHAFGAREARVVLSGDDVELGRESVGFRPLEPRTVTFTVPPSVEHFRVEIPELGLRFDTDPAAGSLSRPFATPAGVVELIPDVERAAYEADQLVRRRRLSEGRRVYEAVLSEQPWHRDALLGLADLEHRRGRYEAGLELARRALALDAYDPEANFVAAGLHRALAQHLDAAEAYGWAARSMAYRATASTALAELALLAGDFPEAVRYAERAHGYDVRGAMPLRVLAVVARLDGQVDEAERWLTRLAELDPLDHFVAAERFLGAGPRDTAGDRSTLVARLRSEYPEQEVLELAARYASWGRSEDATRVLEGWLEADDDPVARAWLASLSGSDDVLLGDVDPAFVFPHRTETIAPLTHAVQRSGGAWPWRYLLAMNLWGRDRADEAFALLAELGDEPDYAPFYVARASLAGVVEGGATRVDPEADLRRAVALDPGDRNLRFPLVTFLHEAGRWEDALRVSADALSDFPGDFDLELVHAAALVETGRHADAIEVLDRVRVLPSEHSSQAHTLFAQAHTQAGLAALDDGDPRRAASHFETAMTWPERLGQGRPYAPEERLQRYALAHAAWLLGDREGALRALEAVVDATPSAASGATAESPYDALAYRALSGLGRATDGEALRGEYLRLAREGEPAGLGAVEDRLLYRVLNLPSAARDE